jgi:serine/threonine-protein kinase
VSVAPRSSGLPSIEKYDLLDEIGHGGMATVYRARDPRLQRDVAIKVIHKHLRDNPEVKTRFASEARVVAKLRHRNIVEVYDVSGDDDEERFLVVELIRGDSLRQVLSAHGVLPAEITGIIVAALCDAAQHAHDLDVIHRDIKPENVLIETPPADSTRKPDARRSGSSVASSSEPGHVRVKLTDFGIAKLLDVQGLTSTGQILGSPAHMAPEQIEGGHVGPQTDVFGLGVLMYECMVGSLPFEGKNPAQVLRRVLDGDFESADSQRPRVGRRWTNIIAAALNKDFEDRVQSAHELGCFIREELEQLGLVDHGGELDSYFDDPDAYRSQHEDALVLRLLARGEQGQKQGDVQGAAADFNRALAFRPNDLAIVKRISSLTRGQAARRRLARIAAMLAVSGGLGGGAFAVAKAVTSGPSAVRASAHVGEATRHARLIVPRTSAVAPTARPTSPAISASATPTMRRMAVATSTSLAATSPRRRKVRFRLNPGGARLHLDGRPVDWSSLFELTPGGHGVRAEMPSGNVCCEPRMQTISVTLPPSDNPDAVQTFVVSLPFRAARARLINAPSGASVSCSNGLTVAAGSSGEVRISNVAWSGSCTQSPGGMATAVTLRAGETAAIVWR